MWTIVADLFIACVFKVGQVDAVTSLPPIPEGECHERA